MAKQKLYQYLQGDQQGVVVALKGVESEDNITYLTFDDGRRCNVEFIAGINNPRAFVEGKYMAEVYDRTNIWSFDKKVIKDDVRYGTLKDTGQVVEGWDPYTHGKDGNLNKAKTTFTAIPPRHVVTHEEMTAGAEKLKALGIDPNTPGYEEGIKSLTLPSEQSLQTQILGNGLDFSENGSSAGYSYEHVTNEVYDDQGNFIGKTTMNLDSATVKPPSMKDLAQFKRGTEIYIPDDLRNANNLEEIAPQPQVEIVKKDNITEKVEHIEEVREQTMTKAPEKPKYSDSPIYSIVSKCKKKNVTVPLMLDIQIPSKSIFNLIQEEYDEESVEDFFNIILSEIKIEDIKNCLRDALYTSYTKPATE